MGKGLSQKPKKMRLLLDVVHFVSIYAKIFWGKTGRATHFGEKTWTGDKKIGGRATQNLARACIRAGV